MKRQKMLNINHSPETQRNFLRDLAGQIALGEALVTEFYGYREAIATTPKGKPEQMYKFNRSETDDFQRLIAQVTGKRRDNHTACLIRDRHHHYWGIMFSSNTYVTRGNHAILVGSW